VAPTRLHGSGENQFIKQLVHLLMTIDQAAMVVREALPMV